MIIVALVVLLVVLSGGPEPDPFLLNPGQDVTFEFELPAQEPMLINVAAKWSGTAETLTITLIRPDASRESPLVVSTSQSNVSFIIDAQEATQGVGGWQINLANPSDTGQAEGTILLRPSKIQ